MPIKMRTSGRKIKFPRVLPMLGGVMDPVLRVGVSAFPVRERSVPRNGNAFYIAFFHRF